MKYVYLLKSKSQPDKCYIGLTSNFSQRLLEHNAGKSPYTSKYKPWETVVVIRFNDNRKAEALEKYLKNGSGYAFAKRHFW
jgi:predicted GIY-YIG superfamily endonuclease